MSKQDSDLTKLTPPNELDQDQRLAVFNHFFRKLAAHRNRASSFAQTECNISTNLENGNIDVMELYLAEINRWAQELLRNAWVGCQEPGDGNCPILDPLSDTSTSGLPRLPNQEYVNQVLNTILFLHLTTSQAYNAHTRTFLSNFGTLDEDGIVATLKNPKHAVQEAERKTQSAREEHAQRDQTLRKVGMGLAAIGGGVLIGVSGGLAAPLVGAGVTTVLGWLGVGGTAVGLLAGGLASSSVVCGALFGVYGSKKSVEMIGRYTREVRDLAIVPVRPPRETLAVRMCVSGWLASPEDVTAPWSVFGGDDTFALQWEVEALMELSQALRTLVKTQAMHYVKSQIIRRTVLAALFSALSPTSWLKIVQVIDNPWMAAKTRASKAGRVLGTLLAQCVLGNRPVTLVGYSLGSLVIFEALQHLATLPPEQTAGLVQDVYLFGAPVSVDEKAWTSARRVVSGRFVNGYSNGDYILAVLARVSGMSWGVAGLRNVEVQGVENLECTEVDGHLKWRGMVGRCSQLCKAPGIVDSEVQLQMEKQGNKIVEEMVMSESNAKEV